jgi:hypothetical protein
MNVDKFIDHIYNYIEEYVLIQRHPEYGICVVNMYYEKDSSKIVKYVYYINNEYVIDAAIVGPYYGKIENYSLKKIRYKIPNYEFDHPMFDSIIYNSMTYDKVKAYKLRFETLYKFDANSSKELVKKVYELFSVVPRPARLINRLSFLDISVKTE